MIPWVRVPWLPWVLLLTHLPGCVSRRATSILHGPVGGSLSVRCTYEQEDKNNSKFWCKIPCVTWQTKVVETSPTQLEARSGRVTIRDDPASLTFTVTLENLTKADSGLYWCGVSRPIHSKDPLAQVLVSVSPAPESTPRTYDTRTQTSAWATERTSALSTTLAAGSTPHSAHGQDGSQPASSTGSLLGYTPFLLLILPKVPVLLGVLGAVLWVRRRPRDLQGATPGSLA